MQQEVKDQKEFATFTYALEKISGEKVQYTFNPAMSLQENKQRARDTLNAQSALTELDKIYKPLTRAIDKIVKGRSLLLLVKGRAGIGKTSKIQELLERFNANYIEISGDISPAYMYRFLVENNGKIIWFKDIGKLLTQERCISMLKVATETHGERIISKITYNNAEVDLPQQVKCESKFIFDYNSVATLPHKLRADFDALKSRADCIEISISPKEMELLCLSLAREPWQKEVTRFLIDNHHSRGYNLLNLRMQARMFNTYLYAQESGLDWKEELLGELENHANPIYTFLYDYIKKNPYRKWPCRFNQFSET